MNMRPVFIHNNRYIYAVRQGETLTGCPYTLAEPYISGQTSLQDIFQACQNNSAKADDIEVPAHHRLLIRFMMACNACRILYQDDITPLEHLLESPIPNLENEPQLRSDISELIALSQMPNAPAKLRTGNNSFYKTLTDQEQRILFRALVKSINQVQHDNLVCFQVGTGIYATGWSELAIQANGCVFEQDTGRLISLPFDRSFNLHELGQAAQAKVLEQWEDAHCVDCLEKLDGCLIMISRYQDGLLVTTPGSFDNEAIQIAKRLIPFTKTDVADGFTYLFELISPETQNVVNYGKKELLVLAGVRSNATGAFVCDLSIIGRKLSIPSAKSVPVPLQSPEKALSDLTNQMMGKGHRAKGYVLRIWDKDGNASMVQLTCQEYLHKFIQRNGWQEKPVFEAIFSCSINKLLSEPSKKTQAVQLEMVETINSILGAFLEKVNQTAKALLTTVVDGNQSFSELLESPVSSAYINTLTQRQPEVMRPYLLPAMKKGGHLDRKAFPRRKFTWDDWCRIRDFMEDK